MEEGAEEGAEEDVEESDSLFQRWILFFSEYISRYGPFV